ncbi:MAG: GTP cyclohydrolase II [Geminicoccaceae bacterium]
MRRPLVINVENAIAAIRCGGLLILSHAAGTAKLVRAAEAITAAGLAELTELSGAPPGLALTAQRAIALGAGERRQGVLLLPSVHAIDVAGLRSLVDPTAEPSYSLDHLARFEAADATSCEAAAIRLATLADLLPAALVAAVPLEVEDLAAFAGERGLPLVQAKEVFGYQAAVCLGLRPVIEARVPLAKAEDTRVVAFRSDRGGVEHFAILIGQPRTDRPVLTRLHSECFTGDLLGSLRCDCGDQLLRAIEIMSKGKDGGVLLYLAQEGRGIGIVNKLRAYVLQDRGFDTVDANQQLGFRSDERSYRPAAEMLRQLGVSKVRLLTNNPDKVAALTHYGINVVQRVPLSLPPNAWNAGYLRTKALRAGHFFDPSGAVEAETGRADEPGADECRTKLPRVREHRG